MIRGAEAAKAGVAAILGKHCLLLYSGATFKLAHHFPIKRQEPTHSYCYTLNVATPGILMSSEPLNFSIQYLTTKSWHSSPCVAIYQTCLDIAFALLLLCFLHVSCVFLPCPDHAPPFGFYLVLPSIFCCHLTSLIIGCFICILLLMAKAVSLV